MAGKGGGAWKVAYADFVTAMMAFFLVMWLVSQDEKTKESIAHYFQGPIGINLIGNASRDSVNAGIFISENIGPVPGQSHWTVGRSIGTAPESPDPNSDTMATADWLLETPVQKDHWLSRAQKLYDAAIRENPDTRDESVFDSIVIPLLVWEMHHEVSQPVVDNMQGLHRELLLNSLSQIDWNAIAQECLLRLKRRNSLPIATERKSD